MILTLTNTAMIRFRKITEEDIALMHAWFNEPHVQKFYSLREWTEQEVLEKLLPTIERKKRVFGFIIYFEKSPIGYLQYYRIKDFPWPQQDFAPNIVEQGIGLDIFIGDRAWVSQGLGAKIVETFLNSAIWPHFQFCAVDPDERNVASIRMFEKCGFVKHKAIHTEDALRKPVTLMLMVKAKPS